MEDNQQAGSTADTNLGADAGNAGANTAPAANPGASNPAAGAAASGTHDTGGKTAEQLQADAVAKYTPNFKFKASDKEHEFDDTLKGLIKDQPTEAKIRELYEKAHGLDAVKQNRQELRVENRDLKQELGSFQSDVAELQHFYKQGDMDSFFEKLRVPEEVIYNWVIKKAQLKELPPEQQAIHEENRRAQLERRAMEQQIQQLQGERQEAEGRGKALELQQELSRPDVQTFAQAFDAKMGNPGAFKNAVCELGEYVLLKQKQNLTVAQAIKQAMDVYSKFIDPSQLGGAASGNPASGASAPGATPAPAVKVIPHIGGKAASPTARKIKTFDELKEFAKNFGN